MTTMKAHSRALHWPPRQQRAVESADAARGEAYREAKKTVALKPGAARSQLIHRCRSEENPAYVPRVLFLTVWLALLLLAGLDRMGVGIDLRHATQTQPSSTAGNASENSGS